MFGFKVIGGIWSSRTSVGPRLKGQFRAIVLVVLAVVVALYNLGRWDLASRKDSTGALLGRGIEVLLEAVIVVFAACMLQQLTVSLEEILVLEDTAPWVGLGLSSAQEQLVEVLLPVGSDGAAVGALDKVYSAAVVAVAAAELSDSDNLERDSPAEFDRGIAVEEVADEDSGVADMIQDTAVEEAADSESAKELAKGSLSVPAVGYIEARNTPFGKT